MLASLLLMAAAAEPLTPQPPLPGQAPGRGGALPTYTVHLDKPTNAVSPNLYGIFFEEINWAGDGGLYAELIRNRGFTEGTQHWVAPEGTFKVEGKRAIVETQGRVNIENGGFAGIGVRKELEYRLNIRIRGTGGGVVAAYLTDGTRQVSNTQSLVLSENWQEYPLILKGTQTTGNGRFMLDFPANTRAEIEWVSMFPTNAVSGIFRKDLFEALKKLKPAFVRFPGGCWVEGETMATAYRWKKTIGPPRSRTANYNLWKYQSTNGLGYHEYLQLCRDLKAVPMFVANCGMSHREVVPMDQMDEYVQDILDAIEYANGPVTSKWGALRAQHGSPEPFALKYLEIGNENGGPAYEERYGLIYKAIKKRYPNIVTIANVWGGSPQKSPVEMLDEHYYNDPGFFLDQADRYDRYDRKGPKVYVGEYAVTVGVEQGNLRGALAEGAFMMGMERNSDVVRLASYAPLFAHPAGKAWNPDLIYFDALRVVETPSFHVQAMFGQNRPDRILTSTLANRPSKKSPFPAGAVGVGTWATTAEFRDLRVIQNGKTTFTSADARLKFESGNWTNLNDVWRQVGNTNGARAFAGDPKWTSYRLEVKARKISGDEGFLITVGRKDERNYLWVNLGGWGNTQHAIERAIDNGKSRIGPAKAGKIESGRWYDIAVDYSPERIRVYLDGEMVFDEGIPERPMVFATAGQRGAETIVKLINVDSKAHQIALDLRGGGQRYELVCEELHAVDDRMTSTLDKLDALIPKTLARKTMPARSNYRLKPHSLTILRLRKR